MKIYHIICLLYLVKADSVSYGPQLSQYKTYGPNDPQLNNQNVRIRVLDHYVQPTEGSPTIQTLYTSSSGSQQPIIGSSQKYSYPKQQVSPTITINSNQRDNNFNNKNVYQNQPYSNAETQSRYIAAPIYESTEVSPTVQIGSSTTSSQSSQSSSSSSSSSSSQSTSSSVNSVATTVNPNHINLVPTGGSSVQIVPNHNQNNYHLVDLKNLSPNYNIYGSSIVPPVEVQSTGSSSQSSSSENSNSQSQSSNFSSVIQTNSPTVIPAYTPGLVYQPGYETSNSFQNINSNSESKSKSNNEESNISIMSVTPVPYNIAISNSPPVGIPLINHQISASALPPSTYQSVDTSPSIFPISAFGPPNQQPIDISQSHPPVINVPKPPNAVITIASSNGIQSLAPTDNIQHVPIVTNVPVTQFQEHEGIVSKTVNVAQPGIKKQTFEIRKPAIQKQYYDIEEKVIVRPAGSVLVEIDEPLSKTSKGSEILPLGNPIITEHNDGGSFGNQHPIHQNNLISFATNQQTLTSNLQGNYPGISSICNQFNPHFTQSYLPNQYSYSSSPVQSQIYYPPLVTHSAGNNNKYAPPAPFYFDYQPNSKLVSQKHETEIPKEIYPQRAGYLNSHPHQIHQNGYSAKLQAVPYMISVGDPNFNYPPFTNTKRGNNQPITKVSNADPGAHTLYAMSSIINNDDFKQEDSPVAASETHEVRSYSPNSNQNAAKNYIPNNFYSPNQRQYSQPLTNVPDNSLYNQPLGGIQYYQESEKRNNNPSKTINQYRTQPVSVPVSGIEYQRDAATNHPIENSSENHMHPAEKLVGGIQYYQHPPTVDSQSQTLRTPNEYINPQSQNLDGGIQYYQDSPVRNISDQNYSIPQQQANTGSNDHVNISFDNNPNYPKVEIHNFSLPIKNNGNVSVNSAITVPTPQVTISSAAPILDQNLGENRDPRYENDQDSQSLNGRGDVDISDNNPSSSNNVNIQVPAQYNNYNDKNLEYIGHGQLPPGSPQIAVMKTHVISANPVSSDNQPAGERTHIRRIVVNQPIETVQIIEEEQPITNVKQVTIQQPMYYKTASVGLKQVYSSVPIFVNHQIPENPNYESCH